MIPFGARRSDWRRRVLADVRPSELVGSGPLRATGPGAAIGLAVFSATFWFVGTTATFLDPRAGLLVGGLAGWVVHRSARP